MHRYIPSVARGEESSAGRVQTRSLAPRSILNSSSIPLATPTLTSEKVDAERAYMRSFITRASFPGSQRSKIGVARTVHVAAVLAPPRTREQPMEVLVALPARRVHTL